MEKRIVLSAFIVLLAGCSTTYHNALCERSEYYAKWEDKCKEYSDSKVSDTGWLILGAIASTAASYQPPTYYTNSSSSVLGPVKPNAYGPGVGMDATGRPVTLQGGASNSYIKRDNAYGPGVHMDQYGNPVRWSP